VTDNSTPTCASTVLSTDFPASSFTNAWAIVSYSTGWVSCKSNGTNWVAESGTGGGSGDVSTSGTPAQYEIPVFTSGTAVQGIGPGTANAPLLGGGGSANPYFSSILYPASLAANELIYGSSATQLSALPAANNSVLVTSNAGVLSLSTTLPTNLAMGMPASINLTNATAYPAAALPTITLTGDTTGAASGGSIATTTAKINGTAFSGVSGHLVSFGASSTPADSGLVAANQVNAVSPGIGIAHFAGATQTLTSSAVNLASGDVTGVLAAANLPVATSAAEGIVEGDGSTLTITAGVIKCTTASSSQIGCAKPDGTILTISGATETVATATSSAKGVVETDGSTISNSAGTISCTTATTSQLGCVKPDGSTVTISGGVISASGGAGSFGGVNAQTSGYTAISGDTGKTIVMNGSSLTLTLPSTPPSSTWTVWVENASSSTNLTVSPNGVLLNGSSSNITLQPYERVKIDTNGTVYYSEVPFLAGTGLNSASSATGVTLSAQVTPATIVQGGYQVALSTTGTSSYTATPANGCGTATLQNGMVVWLNVDTTNASGAATLTYCPGSSLGTQPIKAPNLTSDPQANIIPTLTDFPVTYNSTAGVWVLPAWLAYGYAQDFPEVQVINAAICYGGTASANNMSSAASNFTAACRAGTNNLGGVLQAIPSTGAAAYFETELPADWDTSTQPYINIFYGSGANTSGTVIWTVSSACSKNNGAITDDPAFNAESAFTSQTMATANRGWAKKGQFTLITSGNNCVAGSTLLVKLAVSGTAGSNINLEKAVVTIPRLITLQAN
jgi:hypothetical protein